MTAPALRITGLPPRPDTMAKLGYNVPAPPSNDLIDLSVEGGSTILRWQLGWTGIEDFATGNLTLPATALTAFKRCAEHGVKLCLVAGFGPPYGHVASPVVTASVAAGSKIIPVDTLANINPPAAHILGPSNAMICVHSVYYGAMIDSVAPAPSGGHTITCNYLSIQDCVVLGDADWVATSSTDAGNNFGWGFGGVVTRPNVIVLASALAVPLTVGETLIVNQLRYATLNTTSLTDPGVVAFARYATWIGEQIAAAGCEGYVCIWNEYVWPQDQWPDRLYYYDAPTPPGISGSGGAPLLEACMASTLPAGVSWINGISDVSGFKGAVTLGALDGATSLDGLYADGIHPYNINPEGHGWDPLQTDVQFGPIWYQTINPISDNTGNFRSLARVNDLFGLANGFQPTVMLTECGGGWQDAVHSAIGMIRHTIAFWGMAGPSLIYGMLDTAPPWTPGDLDLAPGNIPEPSWYALQALMQLIGRMEPGPGLPSALPTVVGWPYDDIPVMSAGIYGAPGHGCFFVWQRTSTPTPNVAGSWESIPTPPSRPVSLSVPAGVTLAECFTLRTGVTVTPTYSGEAMTVPIIDEPVAMRFEPVP